MIRLHPACFAALAFCVLGACSPTRPPATSYPRAQTHAFTDTSDTALGHMYGDVAANHPGQSGFHLVNSGMGALMTRIVLVDKAERSVDMQYYSSRDDVTGQLVFEALSRAAARGVRVRILVDDYYLDDFKKCAVVFDKKPNIDIRVFNPYSTRDQSVLDRIAHAPSYLSDYDRRMHNKTFIVDNQVAVIGGRNLGDEYFDDSKDHNLRDADLFTVGEVVPQLSTSFDRYWNSNQSYPISALNIAKPEAGAVQQLDAGLRQHWNEFLASPQGRELQSMPLPYRIKDGDIRLIWANAELAADNPGKVDQAPQEATSAPAAKIVQLANGAQHEFTIISPYFVPLDKGVDWLTAMVKRGVHVRIVTNSLSSTDMVPAQSGYSHYREALVKGGVELYEVKSVPPTKPGRKMLTPSAQNGLHAKLYIIDRRDVVIGSFNFDPRSRHLNTEQAVIVHSPELSEDVEKVFDQLSSADTSYRVMLASQVPEKEKPAMDFGTLAWKDIENGQVKYYGSSPNAGFLRRMTDEFFTLLPFDSEL